MSNIIMLLMIWNYRVQSSVDRADNACRFWFWYLEQIHLRDLLQSLCLPPLLPRHLQMNRNNTCIWAARSKFRSTKLDGKRWEWHSKDLRSLLIVCYLKLSERWTITYGRLRQRKGRLLLRWNGSNEIEGSVINVMMLIPLVWIFV